MTGLERSSIVVSYFTKSFKEGWPATLVPDTCQVSTLFFFPVTIVFIFDL